MEDTLKKNIKEFFKICYSRLEIGEKKYGDRYESIDLFEEIINELADISNYSFLQYVKLMKLREKIKSINESDSSSGSI